MSYSYITNAMTEEIFRKANCKTKRQVENRSLCAMPPLLREGYIAISTDYGKDRQI